MRVNACTIVAKNYLAQARVLARSFARHHPDGRFSVLLLDDVDGRFDPAAEPFSLLGADDLELPEFAQMAGRYEILEMSTAVKPWLLRRLLQDDDHVIYLDPDIEVFAPLDEVAELAREHGMVLTPHNTTAMPRDGRKPSEADILIAGAYNLGFIALGASGPSTASFLDWWGERLLDDCVVDTERGYFVDQRWIDLVPGIVPGLHLLRDPGYNVAYWNLHARRLERDGDRITVNGTPLRFFHYSGYDPDTPDALSKHQDRIRLTDEPVVRELCDGYRAALLAEGYEEARTWPYTYRATATGLPLDTVSRRLYTAALRSGELRGSLFEREGAEAFLAWASEPADPGLDPRLNRWMFGVRELRPELKAAYPLANAEQVEGFLGWLRTHGREQLGPATDVFIPADDAGPAPGHADGPELLRAGDRTNGSSPAPATRLRPLGVNLVGYLNAELGVGEVARQATAALDAVGVPLLPVRVDAPASRQDHAFTDVPATAAAFPVNLLCVNADQTPEVAARLGPEFFSGRTTAGWWWWEVPEFPRRWHGAFQHVDEVWAGSRFVADVLREVAPVPVAHIPTPVAEPQAGRLDRSALGIPEGFLFLFAFDFHSVFARKNPLGVIEAFRRAFAPGDGAVLVVKAINGEHHPRHLAEVVAACADRDDVVLLDRYLAPAEKDGLVAGCDCYVSLHRSEGFGYTMAEAMLLGRPVIATGWSGNADFVTDATAFPVAHRLVPIGPGSDPYPPTARWAEPDLDDAARTMRRVVEDGAERTTRAEAGRAFVREHHSPAAAGRAMAARLALLAERAQDRRVVDPAVARRVARDVVRRGPVRSPRAKLDPRRVARAAVLRAAKPVLAYEHEVARAVVDAADAAEAALDEALAEERAARLAVLRAVERTERASQRMGGELAALRAAVRRLETGPTSVDVDARVDVLVGRVDELAADARRHSAQLASVGLDADVAPPPSPAQAGGPAHYAACDEEPWSEAYVAAHAAFVARALDDAELLERFRGGHALPDGFGRGLDERVVEFPWTAAQRLAGSVLDAGSTLNHAHVLRRLRPRMDDLHIVTLAPEPVSFPRLGVSYLFADLRSLPVRDDTYDRIVCLSTLEHVGLALEHFGADAPQADDPQVEAAHALAELHRVLRPGGELLLSVPVGRGDRFEWVRALTLDELDELVDAFGPAERSEALYRYDAAGWRLATREEVVDAPYRDHLTAPRPVGDAPVAAGAVACLRLRRGR